MVIKIILLILMSGIAMLLYKPVLQENIGSDYFHRSKLAEIGQAIQTQVEKAKNIVAEKTETFKSSDVSGFDANHYVISDYAVNDIANKGTTAENPLINDLETEDFATPVDYTDKKAADYLEVAKYDAGSGDMTMLNEAFAVKDKTKFFKEMSELELRGGNVHLG